MTMSTQTVQKPAVSHESDKAEISVVFGKIFSFNSCLKLIHWHVTGKGSYATHLSLDQAIETLLDATDRLVETGYAVLGELDIVIPETKRPDDYIGHIEAFYEYIEHQRRLFSEAFVQSILDDYQEGIQQLLFRLKRLQ
jgi:DNA-binding ferritin-like protein